jgi:hypothetical protein
VQRAGRNKLMDLADALSQVNPTLQQYIGVADVEFEQFQEEMARKSPEEVQAMLKKTEGELDKQVRRGTMGWLTSPLNQKRKLRAVGKLASSGLVNEIEARMINPNADDPEDLTELANKVRQEYIDKTPSLQTSGFAREGLNEATNARVQALISNYGRQQVVREKADTASQSMDTIYHLVNEGYDGQTVSKFKDDYLDSDGNLISITNQIKQQWDDLGAFSAKEQTAFLQETLQALSRDGNEVKADAFLDWASANLKIGNAKMSIVEKSRLSAFIDQSAKSFEQAQDKERFELSKGLFNQYTQAHNAIQAGRVGEYNGKEYRSLTQLQIDAENIASYDPESGMDNEALGMLTNDINTFVRSDVNPMERQQQELLRDTTGLRFIQEAFGRDRISGFVSNNFSQLLNDPKSVDLQINANIEFQKSIQDKALALTQSGLPVDDQKRELLQFARDEDKRIFELFKEDINTRAEQFDKQEKDKALIQKTLTESTENATQAPTKNMFTKMFENVFGYNEEDGDIAEVETALNVLGNKAAPAEEKEKSIEYLKSYGVRTSAILAEKLKPNAWKVAPSKIMQPIFGFTPGAGQGAFFTTTGGVRYTSDELDRFRNRWMNINSFLETFTNTEVLRTGVATFQDTVISFNPEEFSGRTEVTRLLSIEEIEQARNITKNEDMPDSVKEKARLIGIEDIVKFVKNQVEFAKRLGLTR